MKLEAHHDQGNALRGAGDELAVMSVLRRVRSDVAAVLVERQVDDQGVVIEAGAREGRWTGRAPRFGLAGSHLMEQTPERW